MVIHRGDGLYVVVVIMRDAPNMVCVGGIIDSVYLTIGASLSGQKEKGNGASTGGIDFRQSAERGEKGNERKG